MLTNSAPDFKDYVFSFLILISETEPLFPVYRLTRAVEIKPTDVVEVKLPENWPNFTSGKPYHPPTGKKDLRFFLEWKIAEQRIFFKLNKTED